MIQTLSKKEIKGLNKDLQEYNIEFSTKERIQRAGNFILKEGVVVFFKYNNKYIPSLHNTIQLPSISIDRGAIPYIIKGANVMRPGIISFDNFKKDDLIYIIDNEHKKKLALGIALFDSEEIKKIETGKTIKNIHYFSDEIWNFTTKK